MAHHAGLIRATAAAVRGALWQQSDDEQSASPLAEAAADSGVSATELNELVDAIDQIHKKVVDARNREAGLRRLLQTAQHLLSSPEPEDLLSIIVEATRDLVRSDVAHLNLESGNTFDTIRATTGVRTEAFRRQHTPPGVGLTGLVMRSRQPYVTPDYLEDERLEHNATSDRSVRADGLVTMAAVPMWRGDNVLGVLVASWRRQVEVASEAVDLLCSLSSLAGLAVTNTRLRAEADSARTELVQANQRIRQNNELLEWAAAAHDRLNAALHDAASVQDVTQALHELLAAEVLLLDERGEMLGSTPSWARPPASLEFAANNGVRIRRLQARDSTAHDGEGELITWVTDCRSGEHLLATLVVRRAREMSEIEQHTIDRAATTAALILSTRNALAEAEFHSVAEALTDLLRGLRVTSALSRLRSRGFDLSTETVILVVHLRAGDGKVLLGTARRHAQEQRGLAAVVDEHVVVLLPGTDPDVAARDLADRLDARGLVAAIGADGPAGSAAEIRAVHSRAVRCAEAMHRLGGTGVATVSSLGFVGLLLGGGGQMSALEDFVTKQLGPLLQQEKVRSYELLQTLRSYLMYNGSLRQAASALSIHPNTVLQRLQRIEHLLGTDLQKSGVRTELDLALRTYTLLGEVRTGSASGT